MHVRVRNRQSRSRRKVFSKWILIRYRRTDSDWEGGWLRILSRHQVTYTDGFLSHSMVPPVAIRMLSTLPSLNSWSWKKFKIVFDAWSCARHISSTKVRCSKTDMIMNCRWALTHSIGSYPTALPVVFSKCESNQSDWCVDTTTNSNDDGWMNEEIMFEGYCSFPIGCIRDEWCQRYFLSLNKEIQFSEILEIPCFLIPIILSNCLIWM